MFHFEIELHLKASLRVQNIFRVTYRRIEIPVENYSGYTPPELANAIQTQLHLSLKYIMIFERLYSWNKVSDLPMKVISVQLGWWN